MMEKRAKVTKIKQFEFVNRKLSYKKKKTNKKNSLLQKRFLIFLLRVFVLTRKCKRNLKTTVIHRFTSFVAVFNGIFQK